MNIKKNQFFFDFFFERGENEHILSRKKVVI
jgi:hypothetical protein